MTAPDFHATREAALARDAEDPLALMRQNFEMPRETIYLDGNSLGALPKAAPLRVHEVVTQEWGHGLVRSWNDAGWFDTPRTVGDRIGALIGADAGRVVACDSTSINLFKVLVSALGLRSERRVIVSDLDNFPTDLYMIHGAMELLGGYERRLIGAADQQLEDVLDGQVAVVVLTHVDYRTGRMYDMARVTQQVHDAGALMIWDLAHSAGAVPVELDACDVDFAVGCTYKYLNGGPGSPAFVYIAPRHHDTAKQPLTGWHGHANPFGFGHEYQPAPGPSRFIVGTPPVVSYAALEASLDVWEQVDMRVVREKSLGLSGLFIDLVDEYCSAHVEVVTPRDPAARGSHVSLRHPNGYAVMQALIERDVIGDFRAPDLMRFGFTPLYVSYADVWDAVQILREILVTERWRDPRFVHRNAVT